MKGREDVILSSVTEIKIPLIPGDGVGPELAEAARMCTEALNKAIEPNIILEEHPAGYSAYLESGLSLPDETVGAMKKSPVTLLAAVSAKDCPPPSPMGQMRKQLELFADIRHCLSMPGSLRAGVDLIIVRECSEGFLADRNMFQGAGEFMPTPDTVLSVRVTTRQKCAQISKMAFEYAKKNGRKQITIGHKNVVFSLGCNLFRKAALEQAAFYPDIRVTEELVDGLAGNLVAKPEQYDMILTTNLFGDILSDVAAAQVGNMLPIINAGRTNALFYPSHGAAKQLAGKRKINPLAMLYTISAMLYWLDLHHAATLLDKALAICNNEKPAGTVALPAGLTTDDVMENVRDAINSLI